MSTINPDRLAGLSADQHNTAYERAVLGAMLSGAAAITEAEQAGLAPSDMYHPRHTELFQAILDARTQGVPIEPHAMAGFLADKGILADVGGGGYLIELVEAGPTGGTIGWYARQLLDLSDRRQILVELARVVQAAAGGADAEHLAGMTSQAARAAQPRSALDMVCLGDIAEIGLRDVEMRGFQSRGLPTGFADLDRLIGGMRPGQVWVFAGRPAMGKTVLGMDIARHNAIRHHRVTGYFSMEMSTQELFDRALSAQAGILYNRIRDGKLDADDWDRASAALGPMSEAPLFFDDSRGQTVTRVRNRLAKLQSRHGLHLAVLDHLGLLHDPAVTRHGRQHEVAKIMRDIKELAGELSIPIALLVQIKRESTGRADRLPQLTDLRESGEIEQSADGVVMIHRDDYYDTESPRAGEADFLVRKNRGGPQDTITVAAQLHMARFVDMAVL